MKRYAVHICVFPGERTGQHPPPGTKCELSTRSARCKRAVEYISFAWGGAALCAKHVIEEAGPAGLPPPEGT